MSCLLPANAKAGQAYDLPANAKYGHIPAPTKNDALERFRPLHQQNTIYALTLYEPNSPYPYNTYTIRAASKTADYIGLRINPNPIENLNLITVDWKCLPVRSSTSFIRNIMFFQSLAIFPRQTNPLDNRLSGIKPGPIPVPVPVPFFTSSHSPPQIIVKSTSPISEHYILHSSKRQKIIKKIAFMWNNKTITQLLAKEDFAAHFKSCRPLLLR